MPNANFPVPPLLCMEDRSRECFLSAPPRAAFIGIVSLQPDRGDVFLLPLAADPKRGNVEAGAGILPSVEKSESAGAQSLSAHENACLYWKLDPAHCLGFSLVKGAAQTDVEFQSRSLNSSKFVSPQDAGSGWGSHGVNAYLPESWALKILAGVATAFSGVVSPENLSAA